MKFVFLFALLTAVGCSTQPTSVSTPKSPATGPGAASTAGAASTTVPAPASFIPRGIDYTTAPKTIAFGSCANQTQPQPIWRSIVEANPDVFVFMGDNIYATLPDQKGTLADQYRILNMISEYREAREKIPFLAIWDDGDLGTRDGGADAPTKAEAQKAFLDYWVYLRNSLPLKRDGLYHSKIMGGLVTGKRRKRINGPTVHVIVLDTRSFRSPLKKVPNPDKPESQLIEPNTDSGATVLGRDQWAWFEEQLKVPADIRIVVSSIQVIAADHPYEKWANFPKERERFFELLKKTKAKNVVVLSGDRHMGAIAKAELKGWGTLYDVTASSINRPATIPPESDPAYLMPSYTQENFGLAHIDFKRKTMKVELKDLKGQTVQSVDIPLR